MPFLVGGMLPGYDGTTLAHKSNKIRTRTARHVVATSSLFDSGVTTATRLYTNAHLSLFQQARSIGDRQALGIGGTCDARMNHSSSPKCGANLTGRYQTFRR
jgi:hypothetical protein